ncbi:MAG: hypothetical protein OQK42_00285 [Sedimenticola sp.]|uniref:Uncharacterized protein n=1 Tax=Sedimenticola thiotaurini TaxID=1543721 RepID=A0A558D749_9GAMM|nr:hypothetical protein [Sedimenticola sp.]TVT56847.1 MAG: hypothetical protein FHK82_06435 [Sedimenticola thiotaurini]MCW8880953.1 hypothetical protein [Sedimenticola sp.]MCW8921720.1 hypothetical protein [Sedimenticola sp.]MCW8947406.1 hypothetical protein [Sedimenticola sp.]
MDKMRKLRESVDACADRLDALNNRFSNLATDATRESVETWRKVKDKIVFDQTEEKKEPTAGPDVKSIATELLEKQGHGLEDVIDILMSDHNIELTIDNLVQTIGKQVYITALRKDAGDLLGNAISYSQIASLWNDLGRPAFGGDSWTARSVSILVE